jgi:NTP pyrophosphatase (non-canonical NTP hydrolase)
MKLSTPYEQFVQSIIKPGHDILVQLTPLQASILHMAVGVSGEAGELLDAVKKHAIYQKPLDFDNVREEAGDILFYLTGLLNELGLTINECMEANVEKLSKRYPEKRYTNEAAIARADKLDVVEEPVVLNDDADLDGVKVERVCRIEDPECESCQ